MIGAIAASAATTTMIILMSKVYGFIPGPGHPNALPAPKPNAMAAVLRGVMSADGTPWFLYALGAVFAAVVAMCGVSALAFALGMYLPMLLNSPLLLGAEAAWFLQRSSKNAALSKARHEKGTLIASGFIAGGALVGVLTALLRFLEQNWNVSIIPDLMKTRGSWLEEWHNWIGLIMFLLLSVGLYLDSHRERVKKMKLAIRYSKLI
jgi:uncharacterized oligopeptide transporter (OPT) family protein